MCSAGLAACTHMITAPSTPVTSHPQLSASLESLWGEGILAVLRDLLALLICKYGMQKTQGLEGSLKKDVGRIVYTFHPNTQEAEADGCL